MGQNATLAIIKHCHLEQYDFVFCMSLERGRKASNTRVCPPTWSPQRSALLLQSRAHAPHAVTLSILTREAIDSESVLGANTGFTVTHFRQVTLVFGWSAHCTSLFKL